MTIHLPAVGPDLPVHPRTGQTAIGFRRTGVPIWLIRGGAPDDDAPGTGDDDRGGDADPGQEGRPADLGDAGQQAIERMKADRNAARKELREVKGQLEKLLPLQKLADALAGTSDGEGDGDGKPDVDALAERLGQHEAELLKERLARFRAEVAHEKGLTAGQAKRLVGATREDLAADADELLKEFKPSGEGGRRNGGPRPDPSQGSRGSKPSGREAAMAEAKKRFGAQSTAT